MCLYLIKELTKKISKALPVIITAGLCDTFLIVIAILGVSLILISMPTLQLLFTSSGFVFDVYGMVFMDGKAFKYRRNRTYVS